MTLAAVVVPGLFVVVKCSIVGNFLNNFSKVVFRRKFFSFQVFPADAVLNKDVHLDKNLVCVPVIEVSGQTTSFLELVHVELTYSSSDVVNIEEEFLPVGNKINFTTKYGLFLRSQEETQSTKCQTLNESNDVYIERPRKDQLKFSFSLENSCK